MIIQITGDIDSLTIDGKNYIENENKNNEKINEYYIVKKGDTLYKISSTYNMTVTELKKLNNLTSDLINIGDKLKVNSTTKNTIADEMLKYNGVKEYDGIVAEIQKWYYGKLIKQPWCATCISYFAHICGVSEQTGKHENVDKIKDLLNKNGKIKMSKAYDGNYIPKKGDLIFFSSVNNYNDCTHIGAVISIEGNIVKWIGGNTSDSIMIKENNMVTDKYVVCFGVIDY